jgi:pyruvate,water dikinase
MAMIPAWTSGVMYSADPGDVLREQVVINAVWGLGKSVVDGSSTPDLYLLSKQDPPRILKKEIHPKTQQFVCQPEEGIELLPVAEEDRETPAISDEQAGALAELALRLERHFGVPQDIEWVFERDGSVKIMRSRPLMILGRTATAGDEIPPERVDLPVLLHGGVSASPGVAGGPAFLVESTVDMLQFPEGAVLVTRNPLPQWAALLGRDAAVAMICPCSGG